MQTTARIYKPSKNVMQSGRGRTESWVLEYEAERSKGPDALIGWSGGGDTREQVRLKFASAEEARAYAEHQGLNYIIDPEHERRIKPRNYGDNFRYIPPATDKKA